MKNLLKIGIVLSIFGAFAACEKNDTLSEEQTRDSPPPTIDSYYAMVNKSGHTIAIVQKPACREMTDSLVLFDGVVFGFDTDNYNSGLYFFFYNTVEYESRAIYYDSRYKLDFSKRLGFDFGRRFFDVRDYLVSKSSDWKVFTFTEADYQYAVEHGKDLGEPKQALEK